MGVSAWRSPALPQAPGVTSEGGRVPPRCWQGEQGLAPGSLSLVLAKHTRCQRARAQASGETSPVAVLVLKAQVAAGRVELSPPRGTATS